MVEGLDTVISSIKKGIPDVFVKRRLNFITIHYLYIGSMTLFWSAIMYALGGIAYIDALFFTSGSCTQSGLNTVNVNQLNTGQQVILYMLAMFCNPIAIHSSVVFVRLYWFEKRFKDVVEEARQLRSTRTRSRSRRRSFSTVRSDDLESARPDVQQSVRGRAIQLLRSTGHRTEARRVPQKKDIFTEKEEQVESSGTSDDQQSIHNEKEVRRRSSDDMRLPQQMNNELHIQFLENQRNPKDNTTLWIPSPREFDRGGRVQSVVDMPAHEADHQTSMDEEREGSRRREESPMRHHSPEPGQPTRGTPRITFNEPQTLPHERRAAAGLPRIETGKASTVDPRSYDDNDGGRGRSRTRRGSGTFLRSNTTGTQYVAPYLSWEPTVARNSFFVNLTEEQREELGGIEYRALKTLALVLIGYFFLFHIFGILCLTPWIYHTSYGSIVTGDGQGRAWWGIFTAASSFNDLGFTLTPDSMISFQGATFPLLLMTFLIIIGNTGFPCMLRFVIWFLSRIVPFGGGLWEELQFLLDHPRRCFTLLFPRAATWWLTAILVILNGIDLLFFVILDLGVSAVTTLSGWEKFLVGLFQAASTRTAGFAGVNIANLHPGIQVSYLIMMYISVFPIAISMRRTNVYEEKSLGIYASGEDENENDNDPSYVGAHVRKQLGFDLWWIFLGLFIICVVEGSQLQNTNEYAFTIFSVLFEIVSAYGTVGLSLGWPTNDMSFSAEFHTLSKLVIIAMQIRGRHRGLPYELDRAILLPSEGLQRKEAQEGEKILQRRRSDLAAMNVGGRSQTEPTFSRTTSYQSRREGDQMGKKDAAKDEPTPISQSPQTPTPDESRHRRTATRSSAGSPVSIGERHKSLLRSGLGSAMYKMAGGASAVEDSIDRVTSRSSRTKQESKSASPG